MGHDCGQRAGGGWGMIVGVVASTVKLVRKRKTNKKVTFKSSGGGYVFQGIHLNGVFYIVSLSLSLSFFSPLSWVPFCWPSV